MNPLRRPFDAILRVFGYGGGPIPRDPVPLRPIGVVRNGVFEPRPGGWDAVRSDLILRDELQPALDGIEDWSHVIVVFAFHKRAESALGRLQVHPRGDESLPIQGIFATRSQNRPNPVGVSVVALVRRKRNILRVIGLDAIDGTPILDVKPYIPKYDAPEGVHMPAWVTAPRPETEAR